MTLNEDPMLRDEDCSISPALIRLRDITKIYFTETVETHALSGVSLDLQEAEFVSIAGPSGCGKSTLLSVMGLLERPTQGCYEFAGRRVDQLSTREQARTRNREIGMVFQNFNLIGDLTVRENVELPLSYRRLTFRERRQRADEALALVDLTHRAGHRPYQLSGGQQQRVAVARAIAGEPRVLLADEPTGNLDSANGRAIMELMASLNEQGTAICMVTHDERYAAFAHRTVHLLDGEHVDDPSLVR